MEILDIRTFVTWQRDEANNNRVTMIANVRILSLPKGLLDWILLHRLHIHVCRSWRHDFAGFHVEIWRWLLSDTGKYRHRRVLEFWQRQRIWLWEVRILQALRYESSFPHTFAPPIHTFAGHAKV
jgi:hypothetical protein